MKRSQPTSGRRIDPERSAIYARYGGFDRVCEWDRKAAELGLKIPWSDGPMAVKKWCQSHGKNVPAWLTVIIEKEADGAAPVEQPDEFSGDHVAALDDMLKTLRQRYARAKKHGDPNVIANIGKEYAKLSAEYFKASKAARLNDDNLVPMDEVTAAIDAIHSAMPDRIEGALLNGESDAKAALASGEWRQFCERFRQQTLSDLADRSFRDILRPEKQAP